MFAMIGWMVVFGCVFGGFAVHGDIDVFLQPFEFVIILVAGLVAFIVAYQMPVIKDVAGGLGKVLYLVVLYFVQSERCVAWFCWDLGNRAIAGLQGQCL